MGAATFFDYAEGPDIHEAYEKAVQEALYWHGHEGYSGTIAEKAGVLSIVRPRRVSAEKVNEALDLAYQAWAWDTTPDSERQWMMEPTAEHRAVWEKVQNWWGPRAARQYMDAYNDKWGPALGMETTGADWKRHAKWTSSPVKDATRPRGHQLFAFFGWASC